MKIDGLIRQKLFTQTSHRKFITFNNSHKVLDASDIAFFMAVVVVELWLVKSCFYPTILL
jgi:hypothetical protein